MQKLFVILLFTCSVITAQPDIPKLDKYANDFTGTLSQEQLNRLNSELARFDQATSTQIVFLMITTLDGYPIEMYSYDVAEKNKIGTSENDNGLLFVVVREDRKMRIEVGYGLEGVMPDALAGSIIRNEVAPFFREGNYYEGVVQGLSAIVQAVQGEYTRENKDRNQRADDDGGFPFIYIIFLILMLLFGRRGRGGGLGTLLLFGALSGGRSRGGFSGGGGFGGFSGGGGSFGGGGASGGW
jgi:uncharacterized protein